MFKRKKRQVPLKVIGSVGVTASKVETEDDPPWDSEDQEFDEPNRTEPTFKIDFSKIKKATSKLESLNPQNQRKAPRAKSDVWDDSKGMWSSDVRRNKAIKKAVSDSNKRKKEQRTRTITLTQVWNEDIDDWVTLEPKRKKKTKIDPKKEPKKISTGVILTPDQTEALNHMLAFVDDSKSMLLLSGWAGTGKTFLVTQFLHALLLRAKKEAVAGSKFEGLNFDDPKTQTKELKDYFVANPPRYLRVALCASTNKASRVLKEMAAASGLDVSCGTIHSLLGLRMVSEEDHVLLKASGMSRIDQYDLIILDEVSMVGEELFYDFLKTEAESWNKKCICVGDPAQLPPVGETHSPAFDIENRIELSTIVRQSKGNPIIQLATAIRVSMETGEKVRVRDFVGRGENGSGVILSLGSKFTDHFDKGFTSKKYNRDSDVLKVIAWTNRKVSQYNSTARKLHLGFDPEDTMFIEGERLITSGAIHVWDEQEQDHELALNTAVEGVALSCELLHTHPLFPQRGYEVWEVVFKPRYDDEGNVTIYVPSYEGEDKIQYELNRLAEMARSSKKGQKGKIWQSFWKLRNAFGILRHLYSGTSHSSQGSSFDNVLVDAHNIMQNPNKQEALQCLYVALTRARRLVVLNKSVL